MPPKYTNDLARISPEDKIHCMELFIKTFTKTLTQQKLDNLMETEGEERRADMYIDPTDARDHGPDYKQVFLDAKRLFNKADHNTFTKHNCHLLNRDMVNDINHRKEVDEDVGKFWKPRGYNHYFPTTCWDPHKIVFYKYLEYPDYEYPD